MHSRGIPAHHNPAAPEYTTHSADTHIEGKLSGQNPSLPLPSLLVRLQWPPSGLSLSSLQFTLVAHNILTKHNL